MNATATDDDEQGHEQRHARARGREDPDDVNAHPELLARAEEPKRSSIVPTLSQRRAVLANLQAVKMEARHVRAHPRQIYFIRA